MKRFCLTLDLKDNPDLIEQYILHHQNVWPEVIDSIRGSGIRRMDIYRLRTRLCMVIDAEDGFSLEEKAKKDAQNRKVQEWEALMDQYQERLPFSAPAEKWVQMEQIFHLSS